MHSVRIRFIDYSSEHLRISSLDISTFIHTSTNAFSNQYNMYAKTFELCSINQKLRILRQDINFFSCSFSLQIKA